MNDVDVAGVAADAADGAPTAVPTAAPGATSPKPDAVGSAAPPPPAAATNADPERHAAWLARVAAEPGRHDFYQTLRRFEAAHPQLPRLGEAARPADEPLRVAQPAELNFAPASLHALHLGPDHPPLLMQRIFGLLGPNGPLPIHLTEVARERLRNHGDGAMQRFLDTLTHRFALLFYRAWAQAQPTLGLDRADDDAYARRLGSLAGIGNETTQQRDAAGDASKLHFVGRLARQVRDDEGVLAWCRSEFDVPVRIEPWCGHWMPLSRDERSRLRPPQRGGGAHRLGQGAVLGETVWDVQHKFRIVVGPLSLARYRAFLPGGRDLARLQAIVRQWIGLELAWDLQLVLRRSEVPALRCGDPDRGDPAPQLGRTSWLGRYRRHADADDLRLDVERILHPGRRPRGVASRPSPPRPA